MKDRWRDFEIAVRLGLVTTFLAACARGPVQSNGNGQENNGGQGGGVTEVTPEMVRRLVADTGVEVELVLPFPGDQFEAKGKEGLVLGRGVVKDRGVVMTGCYTVDGGGDKCNAYSLAQARSVAGAAAGDVDIFLPEMQAGGGTGFIDFMLLEADTRSGTVVVKAVDVRDGETVFRVDMADQKPEERKSWQELLGFVPGVVEAAGPALSATAGAAPTEKPTATEVVRHEVAGVVVGLVQTEVVLAPEKEYSGYELVVAQKDGQRIVGTRETVDGVTYMNFPAVKRMGGLDGNVYKLDGRSKEGVYVYTREGEILPGGQAQELAVISKYKAGEADAIARRMSDNALVAVKFTADEGLEEVVETQARMKMVDAGAEVQVVLDGPARFARVGDLRVWYQMPPATETPLPLSTSTSKPIIVNTPFPTWTPVPPTDAATQPALETSPAPDTGSWPARTEARKTGKFILENGVEANFCFEPDGTVYEAHHADGSLIRGLITHVAGVGADGTIYLNNWGESYGSGQSSVVIANHPVGGSLPAGPGDLEAGDCVTVDLLAQPVVVYGVR